MISDSPMFISRKMSNEKGIDIVWLLNKGVSTVACPGIRTVKNDSFRAAYELATAKVWVDNCRKMNWVRKRRGQFYLQTWHANIVGKKVEKDAENLLPSSYVRFAIHDSKMADLLISGSKWETWNYREAFWYDGEIWECGLPRTDIFYLPNEQINRGVREFYELSPEKNIILYAPTFRNSGKLDCYNLDFSRVLEGFKNKFGGEWVILVRLHPNISSKSNLIEYNENVLNGLLYHDINELIVASSALITDYSSCSFDAMEAGKNVFLFATDVEEYEAERGRYFKLSELPFPLAENNDEMIKNIVQFDREEYKKKTNEFAKRCGILDDGKASDRVTERLLREMRK